MTKSIDSFLKPMAPLLSTAAKLEQLRKVLEPLLSPNPGIWQLGSYEKGILTLLTTDAAYATQLKFLCPHLLTHLRGEGGLPGLAQIKIKVTPLQPHVNQKKHYKKENPSQFKSLNNQPDLDHFEEGAIKDLLSNIFTNLSKKT